MPDNPTEPTMVGPLTPDEWMSFFYLDDHPLADQNPLPQCCANISGLRDALHDALRVGGDPDICWRSITAAWGPAIDGHLQVPITDPSVPPALRKVYDAYVAGRPAPAGLTEQGRARMMQQRPDMVRDLIESVEDWDVDTVEGRVRVVARIGGRFLGYVLDPAERTTLIRELAAAVGMPYEDVAMMVDMLRVANGLPWEPAEGARVP